MIHAIAHLVDDDAAGGVNRTLEYLVRSPELARTGKHKIIRVRRGQLSAPRFTADLVVSHLSVCWANLPLFASLRAAYPRTPLIHVEHSYSERYVAQHVKNRDRFETLMRSVMALFDHAVAVSETQGKWMVRKGYCPNGRLSVIESCVDLVPFFSAPAGPIGQARVVGALGRAHTQKGFDILIDAFRDERLKHMQLRVYGDGPEQEALKARAADASNIVFVGFADDPAAAIADCDIIAMPSRWEPYGIVAIEAMAAGRPVICPRVDGMDSHIAGGALELAQNTPECWVERLTRLPSLELERARAQGRTHAYGAPGRFIGAWNNVIAATLGPVARSDLAA